MTIILQLLELDLQAHVQVAMYRFIDYLHQDMNE